ncbi:MAG: glycerol-3-phosphate 1-O-acyltransferase PlsY [Clostridia bacterium]|nr:glycerol-3-phosphate 1-O-acyltransferase PlsY [Clostridia bacterium]
MIWWHIVLIAVCSYLFGNISFARIISSKHHKDITKLGSGNPGTTNTIRNFGVGVGAINLVLDMLKGVIPTLVVLLVFKNLTYTYIAGVSAIVGHVFPVFYLFKGGKGIATMLGVFMVVDPLVTTIVLVVFLLVWLVFKYVSVGSFLSVTVLTVVEGFKAKALENPDRLIICFILFAIFVLTWWAHRANIKRLIIGKESRVDLFKSVRKKIKTNTVAKVGEKNEQK